MEKQPIIALDFASIHEVEQFLHQFDEPLYVKVGMELYLQNGPAVIEAIQKKNHKIFLDLKLHDIPTTVKKAMKGLASLGIDMVNVHAAGGKRMMEEAMEGLISGTSSADRAKLIAVTQLTSTSLAMLHDEQKIPLSMDEAVLHYAGLAYDSGLDGVVCSSLESQRIHDEISGEFLRVTPGIRLEGGNAHDQARISTPKQAFLNGASAIVVGRAITSSENPVKTYVRIKNEWESAWHEKANR
ncbi:orotidine-5'-phosphate decarboxylase [Jeotgalibacillus sp. S-D1]|uniref:orotidine-5'-phosphate decarboxylase n=1 Tax=Jeotgalibacillus sp. S-D1 TaxID=2552189 RepID=UPI001059D439|nr:orotidine-5'-phosphate decarboxylase [Jeotgalibacillus sp. S-D1]TDL35096.1 orotidine-5'-phosphate decarboxylase [Jeotgalibacillus sp. S-D1]